jgi:hypothetical protein
MLRDRVEITRACASASATPIARGCGADDRRVALEPHIAFRKPAARMP